MGDKFESQRLADFYLTAYQQQTPVAELFRARRQLVLEMLATTPGGALLDAGCGAGQVSKFLLERRPGDFVVTALDSSHAMIDAARSALAGDVDTRFVVAGVEAIPFPDAAFDVVLALGVLEYVTDVRAAVAELTRVLQPSGLLILTMQNRVAPFRVWERAVFPYACRLRGSSFHVDEHLVSEHRLRRLLRDTGLTAIDEVYYNFALFLRPFDERFPERSVRLTRRLAPLGRSHVRKLAADLLIAARRA